MKQIQDFKNENDKKDKAGILIEWTAEIGRIEGSYIIYKNLSLDSSHPTLDALERYMSKVGDGLEIIYEPSSNFEELYEIVRYACSFLVFAHPL